MKRSGGGILRLTQTHINFFMLCFFVISEYPFYISVRDDRTHAGRLDELIRYYAWWKDIRCYG